MSLALRCFAACLPGLEPWLQRELEELELGPRREVAGGIEFEADRRALYRANLELGLASHVLVRVGEFHVRSLGELVRKTAQLDWPAWLRPDRPVTLRVTCKRSRLFHSGAVSQRVMEGIAMALGAEPPAPGDDEPGAVIVVRLLQDRCMLSLDASGEPLHRRGWRLEAGEAPLREDLARALVMASGWDRRSILCDPMMGSGTILIEGAGWAGRVPPGHLRRFAFEQTALFDEVLWGEVRQRAMSRVMALPPVAGFDRSEKVLDAAAGNLARSGVDAARFEIVRAPARAMRDAMPFRDIGVGPGAIVTNPPFGRRVGDARRLHQLYQSFGHLVGKLPAGWRVALLAADRRLALRTGLPLETAFLTRHGGLMVRALVALTAP